MLMDNSSRTVIVLASPPTLFVFFMADYSYYFASATTESQVAHSHPSDKFSRFVLLRSIAFFTSSDTGWIFLSE